MQLRKLLEILQQTAPEHLAEDWDEVGLHVGDQEQNVSRALLCIDLTEAVLAEAVRKKVQLILAYHPPIFAPIKRLTMQHWKQRVLIECIRRRIAVYSPHTALDAAEGGVNDWLASGVGAGHVSVIDPVQELEVMCKLAVFSPATHLDAIRRAMSQAGAGRIGQYSDCSFNLAGFGTFRGSEQSNPTVGKAGRFETVEEIRLEMVCPDHRLDAVIEALRTAHPYEEPAFDVYPLAPPANRARKGQGRLVELDQAVSPITLAGRIKRHLGVTKLEVAFSAKRKKLRTIALCAGAGASVLQQAADADCYLTGEMRHHDMLDAVERGVAVVLAGHTQTERPYLAHYRKCLAALTRGQVAWSVSRSDRPPTAIL